MSTRAAPDRTGVWMNFVQANRVVAGAIEHDLQTAAGLSLAQHEVLLRLTHAPDGRLRMLDLARLMLLSKSGITRLVDRMEEARLVRRASCDADRRVTYAEITDLGRRVLDRATPVLAGGIEKCFAAHLSDADARALRGALRRLLEGNGEWSEERCTATLSDPERRPRKTAPLR